MRGARGAGWLMKSFFVLVVAGTALMAVLGAMIYWQFARDLPALARPEDYKPLTVTQILARSKQDGPEVVIGEFYKERRYLTPYEQIPEVVVQAFISAEDDQFFQHQGINLASIIRAAIANFRAGHVVQGGSTITQQVAKSLLRTSERSFSRKFKELILAYRMERDFTKEEILYLYLNQIYLGAGAYGVQAASKTYFGKDVSELNAAEAALIAGMPQAPGKYSPQLNPKRAKDRQLYVLRRMYENRFITQSQMTEAAATPIAIRFDQELNTKYAAYLVEHIRRYLLERYGEKALYEEGLKVTVPTTVELLIAARKSLQEGLREVDKRIGYRGPLKRLKSDDEAETFLKEARDKLIQKALGFQVFLPDGSMSLDDALRIAGIASDLDLLQPGEAYEAVVSEVDDKSKTVTVLIGTARAVMAFETMKWAKPVRDEKNPQWRPEPTLPSKVVRKGDVVLTRVVEVKDGQAIVALDQEPEVQGALLSIDVNTGDVLAMEGGYDFSKSEFNRAIQAQRQPGSAFKPVIFAAALEKGYTPASIIVDSPIVYEDSESGKWKPTNFEEKFYGDTTFRQALIKSRNVPTIKIVQDLQVQNVINFARRLGMEGQLNQDLSISLGSGSTSLLELTRVYGLFPRLGRKLNPVFHSSVVDREGNPLEERSSLRPTPVPTDEDPSRIADRNTANESEVQPTPLPEPAPGERAKIVFPAYPRPEDPDQVLDPRIAYVMSHLMREVVTHGTGAKAKSLSRPAAGKTGTTNDYQDAWFMGFTPNVVTGVWVGFDNLRSMGPGETGARAALPIWLGYMMEAVKSYPDGDLTIPPGVVFANIHPGTGKLAEANSATSIKEAFIEGTEPIERMGAVDSGATTASEFLKEDIE